MGIDPDATVSPAVLQKMVQAAVRNSSYAQAVKELQESAELDISEGRLQRATRRIGQERVAECEAAAQAWEGLSIPQQQKAPGQTVSLAVVELDGGRLQIRDRHTSQAPSLDQEEQEYLAEALEEEMLFETPQQVPDNASSRKGRFWRESRAGSLISYASQTHEHDPCPQIPEVFLQRDWVPKLVSEVHGGAASTGKAAVEADPPPAEGASDPDPPHKKGQPRNGLPVPLVRTVIASRRNWRAFGKLLVAAAWARGFTAATRRAFLADGSRALWTVWSLFFSDFIPIVDFIHALGYVYAAALAGRSFEEGWQTYTRWVQWLWSGQIEPILAELQAKQQEIGQPGAAAPKNSPQHQVAAAIRYLTKNKTRMRYAEYRRQGLPITTSYMESTIKQLSRRVKGTEKFWSDDGGDGMLQLRADYLSDTQPLVEFFKRRQQNATGQRHHRTKPQLATAT